MRLSNIQAIEEFHHWPEQMRRDYHIRAHMNGLTVIEQMHQDEVVYPELSHDQEKLKVVPKSRTSN